MAAPSSHARVAELLRKGTPEEALAAAVVLGALAPKDRSVVQALARCLASEHLPLALTATRALGRIGNADALKALLPLLSAAGERRETGALAIAGCGRAALPAVKKALAGADLEGKRVLYGILAGIGTPEAWGLVMEGFFDDNFEAVKTAGRALRGAVPSLADAPRAAAARTVLAFLKERRTQASRSAVNSAIILLGHLGRPEAAAALLSHSGPDRPRATRRHALIALRAVLRGAPPPAASVDALFPYLDDPEYEDVVEPALALLGPAELSAKLEKELHRLVGARHVEVRQFAVRKLAEGTSAKSAEKLVELLSSDDERIRQSAVHALKRSPRAPSLLLPLLLAEQDAERAWSFVHLMKPNVDHLSPAEVKKVADAALRSHDRGEKRAEALLHLHRHADEPGYFDAFRDRARKARKAGRLAEAERALGMIARMPGFDAEARLELALVTLRGSIEGVSGARERDEALGVLARLAADPGFDLARRLKAEARSLGPDGLYLVGFRLAEGTGDAKRLGALLLTDLAKKAPATKAGRMAKAKLATVKPA